MAARVHQTLKNHYRSLFSISRFRINGNITVNSPVQQILAATPFSAFSRTATAASESTQVKERGIWAKIFLFLPGAITFGLGTWQLFSATRKAFILATLFVYIFCGLANIEMLDYRMNRLEMEPIMWNEASSSGRALESLEFRKVECEGFFDESMSIFVGPRSRVISGVTENGFYVITPLFPTPSETGSVQPPVLVNRGWVPRVWRDKHSENRDEKPSNIESKGASEIQESRSWKFWSKTPTSLKAKKHTVSPLRVIGVVRGSEKPSIFVPENDPSNGQWFYVDVPMIARACGLPDSTIYLEDINADANATKPYPVPKDVNTLISFSVMPQDHLNYVFTWYSLSAAVTFMAVKRIRPKRSHR